MGGGGRIVSFVTSKQYSLTKLNVNRTQDLELRTTCLAEHADLAF